MPSPVTVWLARPTDLRPRAGTLSVEPGRLTFVADDGERIAVPSGSLRSVRRVGGSPVLEVRYEREERAGLLLFYFAEPPPLADRGSPTRPGERRMRRMAAIRHLRRANRRLRPLVEEWTRATRALLPD